MDESKKPTPEELKQNLKAMVLAVLSAIADEPEGVPSGMLYAILMARGFTYEKYTTLIEAFVSHGFVTQINRLLMITPKGRAVVIIKTAEAALARAAGQEVKL